jgi:hypothetical protein
MKQNYTNEFAERYISDTISVKLDDENFFGGLELSPEKEYYFYDFWNNNFIGKLKGTSRLVQILRPGEARMISVHEVENHPQFLSTNRHIMQGYVDLAKYPAWNYSENGLSGISKIVAGEKYVIVLASNGYKVLAPQIKNQKVKSTIKALSIENGLYELSLFCEENQEVEWAVTFNK